MNRNEWNTYSELVFLKKALRKRSKADQVKFIESYKKGISQRSDWTGINKIELDLFLDRKMKSLTKGV